MTISARVVIAALFKKMAIVALFKKMKVIRYRKANETAHYCCIFD